MAPFAVSQLTVLQCEMALHQSFNYKYFELLNLHLNQQEFQGLRASPIRWPAKAVFAAYADVHDGYSQVRFQGTKFYVHCLAFKYHCGIDPPTGIDISHRMYCGDLTSRNINPLFLCAESNARNQTRKMCHAIMEQFAWEWDSGGSLVQADWGVQQFNNIMHSKFSPGCSVLHHGCQCIFAGVEQWKFFND